jgi:hypothetical protein
MLTEDYIMRLINQALAVFMAALGLKKSGQYKQALQSFDQALGSLLGLDARLANQLDDQSVLDMLTTNGKLDVDRLLLMAKIYKEESEILAYQGLQADSKFAAQRSLRFFLEVFLSIETNQDVDLVQSIEDLRHGQDIPTSPLEIRLALLDYLERLLAAQDDFLSANGLSRRGLTADFNALESSI